MINSKVAIILLSVGRVLNYKHFCSSRSASQQDSNTVPYQSLSQGFSGNLLLQAKYQTEAARLCFILL